ncbi:MAG TPA: hypothetical protein VEP90_12010 [Methylomirabilota bacterium]|nr:hypothetical protein [Methylomirabilota bacterium]
MVTIRCDSCYRPMTEEELNAYPWDYLLAGEDVRCMQCRTCPDDCGQEICAVSAYLDR